MTSTTTAPAEKPKSYTATAKDIAKEYGIKPGSVTRLALTGKIPGLLVGSDWRFDSTEVRAAFQKATEDAWKRRKPTTPQPKGGGHE